MNLLSSVKSALGKAFGFLKSLMAKHDAELEKMVKAIIPLVIDVGLRAELSGDQKKKVVADAILDKAGAAAGDIAHSLLNEAIEVAANRYNIQIGKVNEDKLYATSAAVVAAGRKLANEKLNLSGNEAENAGVSL